MNREKDGEGGITHRERSLISTIALFTHAIFALYCSSAYWHKRDQLLHFVFVQKYHIRFRFISVVARRLKIKFEMTKH